MKRYIKSSNMSSKYKHQTYDNKPRPMHEYKGHKIAKIHSYGQWVYKVKDMPEDFYKKYWDGEFNTLKDAKKYVDKYETESVDASTKVIASDNLIDYRLYAYNIIDDEEESCVGNYNDYDEAIRQARKFCDDVGIDCHVVAAPMDPDNQEALDYLEYELGVQPYEVVWQSY